MSSTQALAFAELVREGETTLDAALEYHFTANHYPPLPTSLIPVAKQALELANNRLWDVKVSLAGTGVTHRRYGNVVPVSECIEAWHLEAFLDPDPDCDSDEEE